MNIIEFFLDIIYPPENHCLVCGRKLTIFSELTGLCQECLSNIHFITESCSRCGREVEDKRNICSYCKTFEPAYDFIHSGASYDGITRQMLLEFKFKQRKELKKPLVELLSFTFREYFKDYGIDYIVPVPMHYLRKRLRGFNQASLMAEGLARKVNIQCLPGALQRVKEGAPLFQHGLKERRNIISGSFAPGEESPLIEGANIMIVDDIYTSGTTVNEVSTVLRERCRVNKIYVLTVARARFKG
ncbi:ComF family protein [Halothermothrix orenii]|uniref:Amidophosphoribosyltransferase n=1 Tax=Halothermothrix orenii (strain H 168 / OCM 544 / DSM 9562) TaxID=373903 RepID=B8CYM8_HALOH|nr:ComF family protein [Halothermothrix orenii]ACL70397.1 amidophosphoribosyltransferase [Halothermothrix orenii H 168]